MKISTLTTADLQRELAAREKAVSKLETKRARICRELEAVESEIAALTGDKVPRRGRNSATPSVVLVDERHFAPRAR